ncbi:Coiled-coil domain-containing protein 96, partial [Paragonimus heterotremus]
ESSDAQVSDEPNGAQENIPEAGTVSDENGPKAVSQTETKPASEGEDKPTSSMSSSDKENEIPVAAEVPTVHDIEGEVSVVVEADESETKGGVTKDDSKLNESQEEYGLYTEKHPDEDESVSSSRNAAPNEEPSQGSQRTKLEEQSGSYTAVVTDHTGSETSTNSTVKQEEKQRLKEQLIEQYKQAVVEHKIAREANLQLQTKLAEYFRRKKADAAEQQSGASSLGGSTTDNVVDYEQRYNKYISSLTELRNEYQSMQATYHKQIEELKRVCADRQREVDDAYKEFTNYKYNIGKKALHSRTGRPINPKELVAMLNAEQKKEAIVMEVRLENIKLRNEVAKVEAILKSKEELAEGLHLIDFEQLKIENQTYNEKIEERNEELAKLKRKIASTVQIMTHVKEKLQAVQYDNAKQRQRLGIADAELTFNRDQLTRLKQARDHLRADNSKLRRSCGLLGKTALLLNYEDSVDAVTSKKAALEETKRLTSNYVTRTKSIIQKIESHSEKRQNS